MQDITAVIRVKTRRKDSMDLRYFAKIPLAQVTYAPPSNRSRRGNPDLFSSVAAPERATGYIQDGEFYFRGADLISMRSMQVGNDVITYVMVGSDSPRYMDNVCSSFTPEQVVAAVGEASAFVQAEIDAEQEEQLKEVQQVVSRVITQVRNHDEILSGDN